MNVFQVWFQQIRIIEGRETCDNVKIYRISNFNIEGIQLKQQVAVDLIEPVCNGYTDIPHRNLFFRRGQVIELLKRHTYNNANSMLTEQNGS